MFSRLIPKIFVAGLSIGVFLSLTQSVFAKSFTYPNYVVDIDVHEDSTVDITETLTYRFDGEFRGVIAEIPLQNNRCQNSSTLTCGGFERIALIGVYDQEGKQLQPQDYELYTETDEDTEESFYTIKWTVWPDGKLFNGSEQFTWSFKYRVYGSLGWFNNKAVLYWNAIAGTRGGSVDAAEVNINFPQSVVVQDESLEVYSDISSNYQVTASAQTLKLKLQRLPADGDVTVSYKFAQGEIPQPAQLRLDEQTPVSGTRVRLDGVDLGSIDGQLDSLPPGSHDLELYFPGYEASTIKLNASSGQVTRVAVNLTPRPEMMLLIWLNAALNVLGVILLPIGAWWIYQRWSTKGRDVQKANTIIPLYSPPVGVRPYLLGSVKDEKVDQQDVTGSIIDLAYRGYIKIKELPKGLFESTQNFELTRLEGKQEDPGLDEFEEKLMDALFGGENVVETKDIGARFVSKYPGMTSHVYKEMVSQGYFAKSPQLVRGIYAGAGVLVTLLGVALVFVLGLGAIGVIGLLGPVLLGITVTILGVVLILVSGAMPAKTAAGSKLLAEILGFRMYLYHAERYRLQDLTPDEFERYLSYAVVFGIEEKWAEKFKDIYKHQPDWYDGHADVWDAYWVSRMTRSFSNSMNTSVYNFSSGTGSARGSGWSGGGGSFGGFSGGGGGGGGRGAF